MELVYGDLHRIAAREMRASDPGTLCRQTAVLHRSFICGSSVASRVEWKDRAHFYASARSS
jgi:hypothetical protein